MTDRISPFRDSAETFAFYADAHRAAIVSLHRTGLLDDVRARDLARALAEVLAEHEAPGSAASNDYLDLEARLVAKLGADASALHLGRSRQDLLSAANRHALRDGLLAVLEDLAVLRDALLDLAERHRSTVVPRYTHGVPAQPTTFGHYLLAYAEALDRVDDDLVAAYHRVNVSPLGAAVLATSRFPVDRRHVAALLGFDGIVENSYGANHVASMDAIQSALAPLVVLALHAAAFAQDVSIELPSAVPWLAIVDPALTGESSAMPQKRNPLVLEHLRETAAVILGAAHTMTLLAHNLPSGMTDSRDRIDLYPADAARDLVVALTATVRAIELDAAEAERRAAADYSTMTELADVLYERHGIPFRTGHTLASRVADIGRAAGLSPKEIPIARVQEAARDMLGRDLDLTVAELAAALSPVDFVNSRRGEGGPAPTEMARMLGEHRERVESAGTRLGELVEARNLAAALLRRDFALLLDGTDAPTTTAHERTSHGTSL